jgi:predicted Zn-ribbon and HTH transcriptional regulator
VPTVRRQLIELLSHEPRSASSLARELGLHRNDVDEQLRHAIRSAAAAGYRVEVIPARCKQCDFVFDADRVGKPGRCPSCKSSRLFEPQIRLAGFGGAAGDQD